ncbi:MAG: hypothetical protein ACFE0Q_03500 [Anaerolineae bacterium]
MLTNTPKRKRTPQRPRHTLIRMVLALLIGAPATFLVLHPTVSQSLLADGIALSVMLCASVYLLQQAILWGISTYLNYPPRTDEFEEVSRSD